jgi:hypothetical protein
MPDPSDKADANALLAELAEMIESGEVVLDGPIANQDATAKAERP